jgi:hypothetical protein
MTPLPRLLLAWFAPLVAVSAATGPLISQVGDFPGFTINGQNQFVLDADGDGDLDLVALPAQFGTTNSTQATTPGQGLLIENLGSRNFAKPRVVYLPSGGYLPADSITGDFLVRPGLEVMGIGSDWVNGTLIGRLHIYPLAAADLVTAPVRMDFPASVPLPGQAVDLDGDGLPDAYRFENSTLTWCLNQGGFVFANMETKVLDATTNSFSGKMRISPSPSGAMLSWVHEQHDASWVVSSSHYRKVRFGTWVAESPLPLPLWEGKYMFPLEIADLDNDGRDDLLLSENQEPVDIAPNTLRFAISWGGASGFSPVAVLNPAAAMLKFALIRDWDRDGDPDVLAGPDGDGFTHLLLNDGRGNFPVSIARHELDPPRGLPAGTRLVNAVAGDVDGDGYEDLALCYEHWIQVRAYRITLVAKGRGDGSFHAPALPATDPYLMSAGTEIPSQLIDFDGDGDLDLINQSTWTQNTGGTFPREWHPLVGGALVTDIFGNPVETNLPFAGDLDGDGYPEFVQAAYHVEPVDTSQLGYRVSRLDTMLVTYNDGAGALAAADEVLATLQGVDVFGNPQVLGKVTFADVNADGLPDLCTREIVNVDMFGNQVTHNYWRRNPGGGSRTPHSWLKLSLGSDAFPDGVRPRLDFDGDGRKDWVSPTGYLRPSASGPVAMTGYDFDGETELASRLELLGAADFDGDGDADFLLFNRSQPALFLLHNPLVDERSPIVNLLVAQGVAGAQAGPDGDADGDGRSNFTELLEGTNALVRDAANPPRFSLTISPGALSFSRRADAADLGISYRIEVSEDLVNWAPLEVAGTVQPQSAPWERVTVPLAPNGPAKRFFRLAVSPQTP